MKRRVSFEERGRALRSQVAHTFLMLCGAGGLVTFTGESSGELYPLGKPCFTWDRETVFGNKLRIWKCNKELRISVGSVGLAG